MRILVLSFLVFFSGSLFCQVSPKLDEQDRNDLGIIPVFSGEYPDPTILREGNDFYMTHTSLNNYPGLLIWHSTDLVNWKPVTFALTRNIGEI